MDTGIQTIGVNQLYVLRGLSFLPVEVYRVDDCDTDRVVERASVRYRLAEPLGNWPWRVQIWLGERWQNWAGFSDDTRAFQAAERLHRDQLRTPVRLLGPDDVSIAYRVHQ